MDAAAVLVVSYLLGGIPFGLVLARLLAGVDIRRTGSGNIGATNAARAFPKPWSLAVFLAVYALDFAKGLVPPLWLAPAVAGGAGAGLGLQAAAGGSAVLGHCFSPWLRLRGGKGVATACGAAAAVEPLALLVALAVFAAVVWWARVVAVGSLALGLALAAAVVLREPSTAFGVRWPATALALGVACLLFYTHRDNIRRLAAARRPHG